MRDVPILQQIDILLWRFGDLLIVKQCVCFVRMEGIDAIWVTRLVFIVPNVG